MKPSTFTASVLVILLLGCGRGTNMERSGAGPGNVSTTLSQVDIDSIHHVISAQEQAWDRGDIPGFMEGYSDSACFISKRGRTCGKAGVTANYLKSYPDKAAMGDLTFGGLEVLGAGPDHAWCTGSWELIRTQDTLGGGFSLFWERTPEGWRILRDHTY